jgi:uncharacterized protein YutE (UPF0331/DUF86 family)
MGEKLDRLLDVLWRAIRDLERYRDSFAPDRVLADRDVQRMVLHALYEATQAAIDAGIHVLVARGDEPPATYAEVFTRLQAAGALPAELAARMRGWAGLRNVLAHFYSVVDLARIDAVLRGELADLADYARALAAAAVPPGPPA